MIQSYYNSVVKFVDQSFGGKKPHFEGTVYWMEKLYPNCGETERIAAYAHDIERAYREKIPGNEPKDFIDEEYLRIHQERGAKIIGDYLTEINAPGELVHGVKHLISHHETGGDVVQNALKDADSVSFFEKDATKFIHKLFHIRGYEKVRAKLDWMYNRISSDVAREAAEKNYEYWIDELRKMQ